MDNRTIAIHAVNSGTGFGGELPSVAITVGGQVFTFTPNEARRLVVRIERAIAAWPSW